MKYLWGIVTTLAPTAKQSDTAFTSRMDAARTSVLLMPCTSYTLAICSTRERPEYELSSTLPTNGDTYFAPLFAARIACAEKRLELHLH